VVATDQETAKRWGIKPAVLTGMAAILAAGRQRLRGYKDGTHIETAPQGTGFQTSWRPPTGQFSSSKTALGCRRSEDGGKS